MPLDLSGFNSQPNQWAGLYHTADQMEKRKLQANQLELQKQGKRAAAGSFLQNYLNPKDYLTGTNYDPMILQGIETAMQQGSQLVAAGADSASLMMALGPMVNKVSMYSTNAKNINKQVDDQIKLMRESGLTGYDYSALKDLAIKKAFYKSDANGKQTMVDPEDLNPADNYLQKAIEEHPDQVTTAAGLDKFAKDSPMQKNLDEQVSYGALGQMDKSKVHLIGQNWLQPEYDEDPNKKGHIKGLVPKYDMATDGKNYLTHNFTDDLGNTTNAPVRLLKEDVFDDMMKRRPDIADYMKGIVKQNINEYVGQGGKHIDLNDPRAKLVARAIAYDELNRRKTPTIEHVKIDDKPSTAQVNLNIQSTDQYLKNRENIAAADKKGKVSVLTPAEQLKASKRNVVQVFGDVFNGKEDFNSNDKPTLNGTVFLPDGKEKPISDYKVIDITSSMPGKGLKAGSGVGYKFGRVFFHPEDKSVVIEQISGPQGNQKTKFMEYPEADFERLVNKIAEPNGVPRTTTRKELDGVNYRGGKFGGTAPAQATTPADDFKIRKKKIGWREAAGKTFTNPLSKPQINPGEPTQTNP